MGIASTDGGHGRSPSRVSDERVDERVDLRAQQAKLPVGLVYGGDAEARHGSDQFRFDARDRANDAGLHQGSSVPT